MFMGKDVSLYRKVAQKREEYDRRTFIIFKVQNRPYIQINQANPNPCHVFRYIILSHEKMQFILKDYPSL